MARRSRRSHLREGMHKLLNSESAPHVADVAAALCDPSCALDPDCSMAEAFAILIAPAVADDLSNCVHVAAPFLTILHDRNARCCAVLDGVHPSVVAHTLSSMSARPEPRAAPDLGGDRCLVGHLPFMTAGDPSDVTPTAEWMRDIAVWHVRPAAWAYMTSRTSASASPSPMDILMRRMGRRLAGPYERAMELLESGRQVYVPVDAFKGAYARFFCRNMCMCVASSRCRGPVGGGSCLTRYCSLECQRADWDRHKEVCGKGCADDMLMDASEVTGFLLNWCRESRIETRAAPETQ